MTFNLWEFMEKTMRTVTLEKTRSLRGGTRSLIELWKKEIEDDRAKANTLPDEPIGEDGFKAMYLSGYFDNRDYDNFLHFKNNGSMPLIEALKTWRHHALARLGMVDKVIQARLSVTNEKQLQSAPGDC